MPALAEQRDAPSAWPACQVRNYRRFRFPAARRSMAGCDRAPLHMGCNRPRASAPRRVAAGLQVPRQSGRSPRRCRSPQRCRLAGSSGSDRARYRRRARSDGALCKQRQHRPRNRFVVPKRAPAERPGHLARRPMHSRAPQATLRLRLLARASGNRSRTAVSSCRRACRSDVRIRFIAMVNRALTILRPCQTRPLSRMTAYIVAMRAHPDRSFRPSPPVRHHSAHRASAGRTR